MAEDALKDNLRKLAEIETDIEELSRLEKLFDRLGAVEASLHRVEESVRGYARASDLGELRREMKMLAEGRAALERGLQLLEQRLMDQVARLASADASMVRDLESFRRFFEKLQALETSVDKLAASGFVTEKRFEEWKDEVVRLVDEVRRRTDARVGAQEVSLQRLRDGLDQRVGREEMSDVTSELRALQARIDSLERGLRAQAEATQGSLGRMSEVDAKIIEDLGKVQRGLERLNDVERMARRAAEMAQERVLPAQLAEMRDELLEKIQEAARVGERIAPLEVSLRRLQDAVATGLRREDLEPLRQSLRDVQSLNVPQALEKRDAQLQALRQDVERLSKMDGEIIRELGRLAKAYGKVADLEREVARVLAFPGPAEPSRVVPSSARPAGGEEERALHAPSAEPVPPETLQRERERALQAVALLRKEFYEGSISKPSYMEALRSTLAHLEGLRNEVSASGAVAPGDEEARLRAELERLQTT